MEESKVLKLVESFKGGLDLSCFQKKFNYWDFSFFPFFSLDFSNFLFL
jgi:hypothetical protein